MEKLDVDKAGNHPQFVKTSIEERFGAYRKPTEKTIPKYQQIQEKTLELAQMIEALCPTSPEKASALTLLQQSKMSANAAIAIYSKENE
jgi:hypothetical protein